MLFLLNEKEDRQIFLPASLIELLYCYSAFGAFSAF